MFRSIRRDASKKVSEFSLGKKIAPLSGEWKSKINLFEKGALAIKMAVLFSKSAVGLLAWLSHNIYAILVWSVQLRIPSILANISSSTLLGCLNSC